MGAWKPLLIVLWMALDINAIPSSRVCYDQLEAANRFLGERQFERSRFPGYRNDLAVEEAERRRDLWNAWHQTLNAEMASDRLWWYCKSLEIRFVR